VEETCFDSRRGREIFPFSKAYIPGLVPTHPPTQRVLVNLSPGVKRLGRGAGHLSPTPMLRMSGPVYLQTSVCFHSVLTDNRILSVHFTALNRCS